MASTYEAFEFNVRVGYSTGSVIHLRVHAPDRARAWERVRQMHPRAVEAVGTQPVPLESSESPPLRERRQAAR
jgi:hypothetical protein